MNPFLTKNASNAAWVWPLAVLALVLGVMLRMAWITESSRGDRLGSLDPSQRQRLQGGTIDMIEEFKSLSAEVEKLRVENTRLQNSIGSQTKESSAINKSLQEAKSFAGLTQVQGPGIIVRLIDARPIEGSAFAGPDQIIHDADVLRVVNELWAAGAEAISVNNHRITVTSSFRCVGPVIHVDRIPIASPVTVRAIGDPDTLFGGMNLPGGVLDEVRQTDPKMVQVEKAEKLALPAFSGSTERKFAKPVEPKK